LYDTQQHFRPTTTLKIGCILRKTRCRRTPERLSGRGKLRRWLSLLKRIFPQTAMTLEKA